jgi:ABC-type multidrug transport system ATPase subunit
MPQMLITLEQVSKRYNYEWVFRNLSFTFTAGNSYAVLGPNGSGKSTLMQCISGYQHFSDGKVEYAFDGKEVTADEIFKHIAIATPYMELVEEMTLIETIKFHHAFKPLTKGKSTDDVIEILQLSKHAHKHLKVYSSGMKQRVKLALAVLSDVPVVLLDEPSTNLDAEGVKWYLDLVQQYTKDKLLIVCSNIEREYGFCKTQIVMSNYK